MSTSKLCSSIDMHFFLGEFLHVQSEELAKTLSNIHTALKYLTERITIPCAC